MLKFLVAALVPIVSLAASVRYDVPDGWVAQPSSSSMRVAEFSLPRAGTDSEDASLVLYFFGGTGGSVDANLARWTSQVQQPDGRPSSEVARSSTFTSNGLAVTVIDLSGTYVAEVAPGATERFNRPGYRLIAAVVQSPDGPYFVKAVGPAATMGRWAGSIDAFLKSVKPGV